MTEFFPVCWIMPKSGLPGLVHLCRDERREETLCGFTNVREKLGEPKVRAETSKARGPCKVCANIAGREDDE